MVQDRVKPGIKRIGQSLMPNGRGKRTQSINTQQPQTAIRKSTRLKRGQHQQQQIISEGKNAELKRPLPSPSTSNLSSNKDPQSSQALIDTDSQRQPRKSISTPVLGVVELLCSPRLEANQAVGQKRKRSQEPENPPPPTAQDDPTEKRPRVSSPSRAIERKETESNTKTNRKADQIQQRPQEAGDPLPRTEDEPTEKQHQASSRCAAERRGAENDTDDRYIHPIKHWIQQGSWPRQFFDYGSPSKADPELEHYLEEARHQGFYKEQFKAELRTREHFGRTRDMSYLLARRKSSSSSLRQRNSETSIATPSDQKPREAKSAGYVSPAYAIILETKGSFMRESDPGITDISGSLCRTLLEKEQTVPQDSLFRDDIFNKTCQKIQDRNEAMVIRDIALLIVPSAQALATHGATHLQALTESVNEGWNSTIPVTQTRPQPDYSVGFGRSAFTDGQLEKLKPYVGEISDFYTSYFMGTYRMYFPFLTCEVKCGAAALDIADRQNAHSMTIAVRAIVELYKNAKWAADFDWKKEIHRQILAFSISHDHRSVRIYGHYALIDGDKTTFYRHSIREFSFAEQEGREKWTAYKFTMNVYHTWMPMHFKRICKAIDALPLVVDFDVSLAGGGPLLSTAGDESEVAGSQAIAASVLSSQNTVPFKKPRLPAKAMLQQENDRQKEQINELREQFKQRDDQFMLQISQLMDRQKEQMDLQREQMEQQMDRQKEQTEQQKHMEQQMDRQKEQTEQQRKQMEQQMDRQKEQMERQMDRQKEQLKQQMNELKREKDDQREQIKELMDMLKNQISGK